MLILLILFLIFRSLTGLLLCKYPTTRNCHLKLLIWSSVCAQLLNSDLVGEVQQSSKHIHTLTVWILREGCDPRQLLTSQRSVLLRTRLISIPLFRISCAIVPMRIKWTVRWITETVLFMPSSNLRLEGLILLFKKKQQNANYWFSTTFGFAGSLTMVATQEWIPMTARIMGPFTSNKKEPGINVCS